MATMDATTMLPSPALTPPEDLTPEPARRDSSTSTLSCIVVDTTVRRRGPKDAPSSSSSSSSSASSTPPTMHSNIGSSATLYETEENDDTPKRMSGRVRRVRKSVPSYNENILSASIRKPHRRNKLGNVAVAPIASGESPVSNSLDVRQHRLVQDGLLALHMEWDLGNMPGQGIQALSASHTEARAGKSTRSRLESIGKGAAAAVGKTKSVLGKRSRDVVEASIEKLQNMGRRKSLRSRDQQIKNEKDLHHPAPKRARLVESREIGVKNRQGQEQEQEPSPAAKCKIIRPKTKRYLSQGLYVGQDPTFDPRLNSVRNVKRKIAMGDKAIVQQPQIMPLPMFAGKRLLENGRDFRLPFNVFNPLPSRQPKPEEWRKTHKNVFVGDAADIWKTTKKLEHSTCICEPESGCDEDCFNRFMFYECDDTNCNIGLEHCRNRSFEDLRKRCKAGGKYNVGVEVIKTADRGYGVRSNRTFEPNQIILEYTGEIITQDECDDRMRKRYKDNECFYLMVFDQNMIIDATRGSIARFVNHSCEPNCGMVKWTVAGKPRMALFAGDKGIMTGEELTYDYNFDPFSSKNIQECRCGMPSCRGVLGPRPKDKENKEAPTPLVHPGTKRKLQRAMGQTVNSVGNKKAKTAGPKGLMKKAAGIVKKQAVAHLTKTKKARLSAAPNTRPAKKTSERSQRSVGRNQVKKRATVFARPKPAASKNGEKNPRGRGAGTARTTTTTMTKVGKNLARAKGLGRGKAVGKSTRVNAT